MKLEDTRITTAGVFRCCIGTVALEYEDREMQLGDKSECPHCHEKFTLIAGEKHPMWTPDWQLKENK